MCLSVPVRVMKERQGRAQIISLMVETRQLAPESLSKSPSRNVLRWS